MLAIDILEWPGMNQAFLFSLVLTLVLFGLAVLYGKRRPLGTPLSWGEAMLGTVYTFFTMFLAYGIVPHQWLTHVQNELGWRADKPLNGPWDILKAKSQGGHFPFIGALVDLMADFRGFEHRIPLFPRARGVPSG